MTANPDRMAAARAARAAKKAADASAAPTDVAVADAAEPDAPAAPSTMEKAAITEDAKRAKKVAALRAAKFSGADAASDPLVKVRITKVGHGHVSMGEHVKGLGDLTYDHNEEPSFPLSIAQDLEERGFAEIQ